MLERAISMRSTFNSYAADEHRDVLELDEEAWTSLKELNEVLHIFYEATLISSGQ